MKRLLPFLVAAILLILLWPSSSRAQVASPSRGGTGISTAPSAGQVLVGNANHTYTLTATSSLGLLADINGLIAAGPYITISGSGTLADPFVLSGTGSGGGSGGLAIGSPWTVGNLVAVQDNGTVKSVATSTLGLLTTNVAEGSNLYWTNARFDTRLAATTSLPNITTLAGLSLPYSQLTGTPTIPTKTSDLTNDSGFITSLAAFDTGDLTEGSNLYFTDARAEDAVGGILADSGRINLDYSGGLLSADLVGDSIDEAYLDTSVNASLDLADSAAQAGDNISIFTNDSGFITSETDPVFTASDAADITATDIIHLGNLSGTNTGDQDLSGYALTTSLAAVASSGDFDDLINTPTIPTKTSDLTNDSGFITSYSETDPVFSAAAAASITSTDLTHLANLSGSNTGDQDLSGYALTSSLADVATSGSYDDLLDKPTIPAFFAYPFPSDATTTKLTFSGGLATTNASTTALSATTLCIGSDCRTTWPSAGTGSVTSVALSAPTGLSISGSPITTSGTLALSWATGYEAVLSASTTDWDDFYRTPSSRITAGTGLSWSGNTLSATASTPTWGSVGGTLSDQTDLSDALDAKADSADLSAVATSGSYTDLSGTPSIPDSTSDLTNDSGFITSLTAFDTDDLAQGSTNKYWTDALFDSRLSATTSLPNITTLSGLSLPYSQLTDTPSLSAYLTIADWLATTSAPQLTTLANLSLPYAQLTGTPTIPSKTSDLTNDSGFISSLSSFDTGNLAEGSNLYFTETRAQDAIALTTTGTSGPATYSGGTLNIPQYAAVTYTAGTGLSLSAGAFSIDGSVATLTGSQTITNKDLTSGSNTFPTFNQNTTGSAAKWTTARTLAGNSVDGSADVAFANKFIVQGTSDTGLSGAQFLGSLSTGLVKNTTTTGALSIASNGTDYTLITATTCSSGDFLSAVTAAGIFTCGTPAGSGGGLAATDIDTSSELLSIVTDETGTGSLVFSTSPTFVTPALGTIASGVGTALTALNGENIEDDTIDDDSIDFSDVTLADLTFDVGGVSTTEFGYLNGVTSAIQTQLDALGATAGQVWTGLHDFGGAVLEIPNGTAPTANDPGELAHDTTDNQLILDDFVVGKETNRIWGATIASTSAAFTTSGDLAVPVELDGYTMTHIRCKVDGGTSKVIAIKDASGNSTENITCGTSVTSDDGSISNAAVTAAEEMYIDFGASSGSVDTVSISVFGTWTRE